MQNYADELLSRFRKLTQQHQHPFA